MRNSFGVGVWFRSEALGKFESTKLNTLEDPTSSFLLLLVRHLLLEAMHLFLVANIVTPYLVCGARENHGDVTVHCLSVFV